MSLCEETEHELIDAILSLGYPKLNDDVTGALHDMEHALQRVAEGDLAKVVRFELYRSWALRAGCKWGSCKASERFEVLGTSAYAIVKRLVRDGGEGCTTA